MPMFRSAAMILALCLPLSLPLPAAAQSLPGYTSTTINDTADLLPPADEAALAAEIQALRDDTGIELVVATYPSRLPYGWNALEPFATALFNDWGVGDADRNNGILVLVLRDDREMRIELGSGYGPGFDRVAQSLVDVDFLPAFRNGDYRGGLMDGTRAVISEIARPMAKGKSAPTRSFLDRFGGTLIPGGFVLGFLALIFRRFIGDQFTRFRRCPSCGQRALHVTRETTIPATGKQKGQGVKHTRCSNCSYDRHSPYVIASPSRSSGGSFGGGSSSGGGASGRW